MKKIVLIIFAILFSVFGLYAQEIVFKCEAPKVVGLHERFRVSFTVNSSKPSDFKAPTF